MTSAKTIRKANTSKFNFHNDSSTSIRLNIVFFFSLNNKTLKSKTHPHNIYILQTSQKRQFITRNSNKPTSKKRAWINKKPTYYIVHGRLRQG